eukprot:6029915-Alexandrium_andersonii.AAC.1
MPLGHQHARLLRGDLAPRRALVRHRPCSAGHGVRAAQVLARLGRDDAERRLLGRSAPNGVEVVRLEALLLWVRLLE